MNMCRYLILVFLAITLPMSYYFYEQNTPIEKVKNDLKHHAFDETSIIFRDVRESSKGVVCGELNGKNRLGAYVGYKRFVGFYIKDLKTLSATDDESAEFDSFYSENCL